MTTKFRLAWAVAVVDSSRVVAAFIVTIGSEEDYFTEDVAAVEAPVAAPLSIRVHPHRAAEEVRATAAVASAAADCSHVYVLVGQPVAVVVAAER